MISLVKIDFQLVFQLMKLLFSWNSTLNIALDCRAVLYPQLSVYLVKLFYFSWELFILSCLQVV